MYTYTRKFGRLLSSTFEMSVCLYFFYSAYKYGVILAYHWSFKMNTGLVICIIWRNFKSNFKKWFTFKNQLASKRATLFFLIFINLRRISTRLLFGWFVQWKQKWSWKSLSCCFSYFISYFLHRWYRFKKGFCFKFIWSHS